MKKKSRSPLSPVESYREQCRAIFGDPPPPHAVYEPEFDGCDDALRTLARTDWRAITAADLGSYYLLNLVYHDPLQPDLFGYLFPLCLAAWKEELMADHTSYFSEEIYRVFARPLIRKTMMNPAQSAAVTRFIADAFDERLTAEREFIYRASETPAYRWFDAFHGLAESEDSLPQIWQRWWQCDTPGHAVCALMYASCLIYDEEMNPLFPAWTRESGGGPPALSLPVHPANRAFLAQTLTADFIIAATARAAARLQDEPEAETAKRIADDAVRQRDMTEYQCACLQLA